MLARSLLFCKNVNICVHSRAHARGPAGRVCQLELIKHHSPCFTCTRVPDPRACDNKECRPWRQWFIDRWALIHAYGQLNLPTLDPCAKHDTESSRGLKRTIQQTGKDPCEECICPKDFCAVPCKSKRMWQEQKEDVFL